MVIKRYEGGILDTCWGTWDDFWQSTSISGANNAGKARDYPYIRRIFWIIIFSVCFYFTVTGVISLFVEYYSFPVDYEVSVFHNNKVSTILRCVAPHLPPN